MDFDLLITILIVGAGLFSSSIFAILKKSMNGQSTFFKNLKQEIEALDEDPEKEDSTLLEHFRDSYQGEQTGQQSQPRPKRNARKGNRNTYKKAKRNQRSGLNSQELPPVKSNIQNTAQKRQSTFKQSDSSEFNTVKMKRDIPTEKPKKMAVQVNKIDRKKLREALIYKEILDKPKSLR